MNVLIEMGFVKISDAAAIDLELIETQSQLLFQLWMLAGTDATAKDIADVIEAVCAYKGWSIGIDD